ncbi:Cell wall integrity and stress response component 4 [Lithohypha guttulata]|uniref:Cell wall integrity and stress response component 4 n=1 Tax=Lithohypha guttulata TaxID=1690604 RepID=UPI002DDE24CB|nr:Cell wall integrity and stress response component 4 [Lithohypha guttulata]
MSSSRARSQPGTQWYLGGLLFLLLASSAQALSVAYCSPQNSGQVLTSSPYMSNGFCQTHCQGSYVFAVIQGEDCWCSNEQPANTVPTANCNEQCPGYPADTCGNPGRGYFAYFNLGGSPTGTYGGSSPSSSRAPSSSTSAQISTSSLAPSSDPQTDPGTSSSTTSTYLPPPPPPPPTSSSSTSPEPSQVYTSVVTVTGRASTILVTPTPAQTTDSAIGASGQQAGTTRSSGLSGGAVAGIVVGVAIIIGLAIGAIVFFILRRRHRKDLDAISEGASVTSPSHASKSNGGIPSRQISQMSSAGLLTRTARPDTGGFSQPETSAHNLTTSDRASTHMTVDQRLNPWAIYSNEPSRVSNVSLQDNQDYSRQLRVANPDL